MSMLLEKIKRLENSLDRLWFKEMQKKFPIHFGNTKDEKLPFPTRRLPDIPLIILMGVTS